jgi:hypothetical protein
MVAQPATDARAAIRAEVERLASAAQADVEAITRAGAAALQHGMAREADAMFGKALQLLGHFIGRRDAQRALATEVAIYNTFVKAVEDEAHYERCFALWRDAMAGLGESFAQPLAPPPPLEGPLRVGFVFHTGIVLGHTEVLLRLLQTRDRARVAPRIYAIFGHDDEFQRRAAELGVPVEAYGGGAEGPHQWLRRRMAAHGEPTAVWVSAPPAALFMFGARVAPVQVFWSLKYHAIRSPQVDGYLTYGSWGETERTFHGQRWTVCPVPLALDPRPPAASDVQALRARFPQRFLMGTLAREEKIDSRPFLESVVALLRRHPEAGYLWTGHARHAGIDAFFRAQGVADRCHFVGWVDTPLYAPALDLFLETFPLGCGVTGYQALGAGRPLVSYLEPNTIFGMQYWSELAAGPPPTRERLDEYPVLVARDAGEYVELASRLVTDTAFREHWGSRGRRFHDEEVTGIERYSRRFFDTVAAVAARKAAR